MSLSEPDIKEILLYLAQCRPALADNLDTIVIMLSFLPVKSLGRFMAVCKSWNSVIGRRFFIEMQLSRSIENPDFVVFKALYERCASGQLLAVRRIIASWNGLVLQETSFPSSLGADEKLAVWNPSTQKMFSIPDDNLHRTEFGLAYGPECYDYKIYKFVRSWEWEETERHECRVYLSTTGCWKSIGLAPCSPVCASHVFINGVVYWQTSRGKAGFPGVILSVDMSDNFHTFSQPELGLGTPYLVNLNGSLGLVVIYSGTASVSCMTIWVLEAPLPIWKLKLKTRIRLVEEEPSVGAAAQGNEVVVVTPRRYLTFDMDKKAWTVRHTTGALNNGSSFPCFFSGSLLPCNGVMGP